MTVRIVTDSTCDIPAALVDEHALTVIPAHLNIGGQSLRDGVDITRAEFYRQLPALPESPTTSAPAAGVFEAAYRALAGAEHIVSIHAAAALSGIFNAARLGAEALSGKVTVVDSGQLSLGLGWQVLAAAEAVRAGQPLAAVLEAVAAVRRRIRVYALLDTLEFVRRSGRVSSLKAGVGAALQIKPIIELAEGQVSQLAQLRTRHKALEKLLELAQSLGRLERLAVLHTDAAAEAEALRERLAGLVSGLTLVVEATTVIGTHVGPKAVGIAAVMSR